MATFVRISRAESRLTPAMSVSKSMSVSSYYKSCPSLEAL